MPSRKLQTGKLSDGDWRSLDRTLRSEARREQWTVHFGQIMTGVPNGRSDHQPEAPEWLRTLVELGNLIDHGLRDGSRAEAQQVGAWSRALGVPALRNSP